MMTLAHTKYIVLAALFYCLAPLFAQAEGLIADQRFKADNEILVTFCGAVDRAVAENIENYTVFEEPDPDIQLELESAVLSEDGTSVSLRFKEPLNTAMTHVVSIEGLAGMDKSYVEAARDLGAGDMRAFWDITFPLLRPAIVSGMLISFAMSMDDVIISMFLTNVNTNTLPIKIYTQLKTGVTPKTNALCALMFGFTLLLGLLSMWIGRKRKDQI